ncbi:MAG: molybdopterin-synthase adenylyltransferase MoeB [Alphaproteobacteria bacterium]|nr:molybdopterin-synthase adenylyltransferase MoeB [Alphaproteobacteria bacterium]
MSLTDDAAERYARHLILREVGGVGQQKLLAARVLLIGAGGLGSPLALYLAAAGVGTIGLIDDDRVALSNLQRQIAHRTQDLGRLKVESAAEAMHRLNPHTTIIPIAERLTAANAPALFANYDVIADGSDNFDTRFAANDAAFAAKRTLVSAAIGEFDGQLATFKAHERGPDGGQRFPCYRCLLPALPPPGTVPTCSEAGVIGALTGILGAWAALEVIKEILQIGESLAGRLILFDGLGGATRTVRLKPDPSCPLCA